MSSNGELEPEVDEDKIVTDEDRTEALVVKGKANKAFAGGVSVSTVHPSWSAVRY